MNAHEEEGIFEQRKALMVPPNGRISTVRIGNFLKPTVKKHSMNGPALKLPYLPLCSESSWPISVSFNGWYDPLPKWTKWVEKMVPKYQYVWQKSGIFEALMGSMCKIQKNKEVVFGVAERWCCETSTFRFQWAEATVTLEDVLVLGGFSVLGHPFSMPLENRNLVGVKERLNEAMKSIVKSRRKGDEDEVSHGELMDYFMDSGDALEHEAFLVLWLSRCVLPGNELNAVNRETFSIAIYLARGIRIALGPPVLASLYRDLSLLKQGIVATSELSRNKDEESYIAVTLWSPIQFVQVWAWERFPPLQPRRKVIPIGHPRSARWHGVNRSKRENIRWILDGAGDSFLWRPYAIRDSWLCPQFYKDEAQWVSYDEGFSEELETYARCLRVSELVGTDSVEAYLPHRVAMQFGMDQDLPQWIPKSNATPETAWENYNRPVCDAKLYFPHRLFEGDVTKRYLEWWEKSVVDLLGGTKAVLKGLRSLTSTSDLPGKHKWGDDLMQIWRFSVRDRQNASDAISLAVSGNCLTPLSQPSQSSKKRSIQELLNVNVQPISAVKTNESTSSAEGNVPDVPPGFPPKSDQGKGLLKSSNMQHVQNMLDVDIKPILLIKDNPNGSTASNKGDDPDVPPGFPPKPDQGNDILKCCNMQHMQNRSVVHIKPFLIVKDNCLPSLSEGSDDVPPGFTPLSQKAKEKAQASIGKGYEPRQMCTNNPFLALKKQRSSSSAEGNGGSRMLEGLLEPMGTTKQSEATIRTTEPAAEIAQSHETRPESSIQSEGGFNFDERSSFLTTKLSDLDMDASIKLVEKVLAEMKAKRSGSAGVKQEPDC
ncbi:hypothetical protein DCAR_0415621 [Daucus carota subsp. sativus]|uniref:Aminotransferase-like plant mobile domain-containing protein n=1 Tax=Daucus carota subsp. sativus TaxID=79200 RepID=A0AAF1AX61_DAUCS|nr:hypothetical protein DCAR_0415621 [Daucus carota subsp. sativus]